MTRNSIGQFIAALRRANGMTQQEVADRLNVSNKAVSRWERDECAPDISLIPAIAEMFGVTCDEILKGQRIIDPYAMYENKEEGSQEENREKQDKKDPRVQKQVKSLVNRTLSKFKTLNYISAAISVVGMICMFGISYGFFRPIIAFGVTMLLEVGALFLAIVAVSKIKAVKADNELFEEAEDSLISKFSRALGSFSFASFFAVLAAVLFAVPLVLSAYDAYSVIAFSDYFRLYVGGIVLILVFVVLICRKPYYRLITGLCSLEDPNDPDGKEMWIMNIVHFGLCVIIQALIIASRFIPPLVNDDGIYIISNGFDISALACAFVFIVFTTLFLIKNKSSVSSLIPAAIRNFLFVFFFDLTKIFSIAWYDEELKMVIFWHQEYLWYTAVYIMLVFAVYYAVLAIINKVKKAKNN